MSSEPPAPRGRDRFEHVVEVFAEALERPAAERPAFLDERCADTALHREVLSLLASEEEADVFMEEPLVPGPSKAGAGGGLPGGGRLGSYQLLRPIGEGGMSTVYLGSRDDDTFRRRVAVKVIRRGMESPDSRRRLQAERQILASLHHPYIAELYDGGATPEGLPYFVMEHVEGLPIDTWCEKRRLGLDERIDLFVKVCEAVHYAHQNLVVHRDIKPSNILVSADGTPRLLDFGIAKFLNPELAGGEIEPTATWMRVLTPQYASPEQIRGEKVTTASDVYSLGVLLYKLLTGRLPRQLAGKTAAAIERELAEKEPLRPSTAVSRAMSAHDGEQARAWHDLRPEELTRKLRGDLDMIVLKALRGDAQKRYGSAVELAEELRRYRSGFPVGARHGNVRYRAAKFLRRHWLPAAAAVFVVALVAAFVVHMAFQSAALERERDQARRERDEKQEVLALVEDVFQLADPGTAHGETFTVREALDKSGASLTRRLGGQPAVEAALRRTIGRIYLSLGLLDEAESHLSQALELARGLYGPKSLEVSASLADLGVVHREKGRYDEAEALTRKAVALARELAGDDDSVLVAPLNRLTTLYCYKEDYESADAPSREALELARRDLDDTHAEMAEAVNQRAVVLRRLGELEEAEALYLEGLGIARILYGEEHPEVANILNNLAVVLKARGDLEGAEARHRETLALRRKLYSEDHTSVAQSLYNLASVLAAQGQSAEAEAAYRESASILLRTLGEEHPLTRRVVSKLSGPPTQSVPR